MKTISLDLELTTLCNQRCGFCYLRNRVAAAGGKVMSAAVQRDAITLLSRHERPKASAYGGEPLVASETVLDVAKQLFERCPSARLTVMTNGTICDAAVDELARDKRVSFAASNFGGERLQEAARPGTWGAFSEFRRRHQKGRPLQCRMTIMPSLLPLLQDGLRAAYDAGATGITPMPDFYSPWTDAEQEAFLAVVTLLGEFVVERHSRGGKFYSFFTHRPMPWIATRKPRGKGCGAGRSLFAVSVEGNLFPCHRFTTEPLDSPWQGGTLADALANGLPSFAGQFKPSTQPACAGCEIEGGCNGGCRHVNWKTQGDLLTPHPFWCRIMKHSFRVAAGVHARLRDVAPDWWVREKRQPPASAVPPAAGDSQQNDQHVVPVVHGDTITR